MDKLSADGNTPLHLQVKFDNEAQLKRLITLYPQDVNAQNHLGQTPMHLAYIFGNLAAVFILSSHGGRVDVLDNNGKKPFDYDSSIG